MNRTPFGESMLCSPMDDCVSSPCGVEVSCDVCSIWGRRREEGLSSLTVWSSVFMFKLKPRTFQFQFSVKLQCCGLQSQNIHTVIEIRLLTWTGYVQLCLPSSAYCPFLPGSNPSHCHNAVWPSATALAWSISKETMNNKMSWMTCVTKARCLPGETEMSVRSGSYSHLAQRTMQTIACTGRKHT